jgi:uncharacterized protein
VVASDPIDDRAGGATVRVLFGTRTATTFVVTEATWQALTDGRIGELPEVITDRLVAAQILVDGVGSELDAVLDENETATESVADLYQVIQPTGWCQLDCGYCGQEHAVRFMAPDDQDRTIDSVRMRVDPSRHRRLRIGWFGAEPLVGLRVMRRMSPRLRAIAAESGLDYRAKIVTNGLLLSAAVARELVDDHAVEAAEVTLDGTAEFHDRRRIRKRTAGGSFDRIFANLVDVANVPDLSLQLIIRCNVDRFNAEGVSPLIHLLAAHDLNRRASFYLAPIHAWGNDADQRAMTPSEFADREVEWLAEMIQMGFTVGLLPSRKPIVCMAVQRDAELVDATGGVFNCTEVSQVPYYGVPNRYAIGQIDSRDRTPNRLPVFNEEVRAGAYDCPTCPMLPVCGGGCPKQWHEGRAPCPSAKHNIAARLALFLAASRLAQGGGSSVDPSVMSGMH